MRDASAVSLTLYAVDLAGNSWDVQSGLVGGEALAILDAQRKAHSWLKYGLYSEDDPEAGDMELRLEQDIADAEYDRWKRERKAERLCVRWYPQDGPVCEKALDHLGPCVSADGTSTLSMAAAILGGR